MRNATKSSASERKSIPVRGHTVHVWPTGNAHAWQVVRDADGRIIADGEAGPEPEAWAQALEFASASADHERRRAAVWDKEAPLLTVTESADTALPGLARRLERIHNCAYGIEGILSLLWRNAAEEERLEADPEGGGRPLSVVAADALLVASRELASIIQDSAHDISTLEARHA